MKFTNLSLKYKIIILIVISLGITFIFESTIYSDNIFKDINATNNKKISYSINDFYSEGYNKTNDKYVAATDDPWFLKEGINNYISNLTLNFQEPLEKDLNIDIYYDKDNEGFSQNRYKSIIIPKGATSSKIRIGSQVSNIRIDIGNKLGDSFKISNLELNDKNQFIVLYMMRIIITFTLILLIMSYVFILHKKHSIEKNFIIASLVIGMLYSFIVPINAVPDEIAHFQSAYRISNKILFVRDTGNPGTTYMRKCDDVINDMGGRINEYSYMEALSILKTPNERQLIEREAREVDYFSIVYLPSAIVISICRILNFNPIIMYMLGRIINLIIFVFLSYLGLKKMPIGKSGFFVILMLPMVLHQGASYSADAILNGLSFAFIGYAFYMLYSNNITKKDVIATIILAALLAPTKITYFPILFIAALIFKEKYKNTRKHKLILITFIFSIVFGIVYANIGMVKSNVVAPSANGVNTLYDGKAGYTMSFIFENPKKFIDILVNTIKVEKRYFFDTMFGSKLGPLNIILKRRIIVLFQLLFIVACFNNKDSKINNLRMLEKGLLFIIISSVTVLIETALFLAWTHYGSNVIEGIQGRYFLPILPFVMLLLRNNNLQFKKDVSKTIVGATLILQYFALTNLFNIIIGSYN